MDLALRRIERRAAGGDPSAQERLQRERCRAGEHGPDESDYTRGAHHKDGHHWHSLTCVHCNARWPIHRVPKARQMGAWGPLAAAHFLRGLALAGDTWDTCEAPWPPSNPR